MVYIFIDIHILYSVQYIALQVLTHYTCAYGSRVWVTEVLEQQEIWPDMPTIAAVHGTGGK